MYLCNSFSSKTKILFLKPDIKTFNGINCNVIGLKLLGSILLNNLFSRWLLLMFFEWEQKYGDLLKTIIRIWSRRLGDPLDFTLRITFVISWFVGGVSLKACIGVLNFVNLIELQIQVGELNN